MVHDDRVTSLSFSVEGEMDLDKINFTLGALLQVGEGVGGWVRGGGRGGWVFECAVWTGAAAAGGSGGEQVGDMLCMGKVGGWGVATTVGIWGVLGLRRCCHLDRGDA